MPPPDGATMTQPVRLQLRVVPDGTCAEIAPRLTWGRCFRSKLPVEFAFCFAVHSLRKEKVMGGRVIALLIPLAITLPQLQTSRPVAAVVQELAAPAQPLTEPAWSYETRRLADAAMTRVVLELPLQAAVRMLDGPPASAAIVDSPVAPDAAPQAHTTLAKGAAPKLARTASPVNLVSTSAATRGRQATRRAQRRPADVGCPASVHCAPVVVAKVTPVVRRPL
jgi:hypothetical protein